MEVEKPWKLPKAASLEFAGRQTVRNALNSPCTIYEPVGLEAANKDIRPT